MDDTALLRAILDAEKEASRLCGEADELRARQAETAAADEKAQAAASERQTEEAALSAWKQETDRADAQIARMQAETEARIVALKADFEKQRAAAGDKLFGLATGRKDA